MTGQVSSYWSVSIILSSYWSVSIMLSSYWSVNKGSLTVKTPLYLLLVGKQLLESFKHKVLELGANAGFKEISEKDYDILKSYSVTMNKQI